MAAIPALCLLILARTHASVVVFGLLALALSTRNCIRRFASRTHYKAVHSLRLHNNEITLNCRDNSTRQAKIAAVCLNRDWVVISPTDRLGKIIIDSSSTDIASYRAIRRQVIAYGEE